MAERIPQTTTIRIPLQAYLSSDHVTPATGKTIVITLSKNGAAYGNPSGGATNATEIASGSYYVDLTTTDTGTLGPLFIKGSVATIDDVIAIYNVVKATNGGLTALPDTACTTNASLLTSGSGTDQLTVSSGNASADAKKINAVSTSSVTTINANIGSTQPVNFSGTGASAFVKSDIEQINAQSASASGTVTFPNATLASTANITAGTITTVTNLTNAPTAGDFTATMKTSIGTAVAASAVASVTGNVGGNVTGSVGSISGVTFPTHFSSTVISAAGAVTLDGTSALAEAYSTQGSAFTLAQCLYDMHQFIYAHEVASTTWTVLKRDNSTTAKTATLDSASAPTQLVEAT